MAGAIHRSKGQHPETSAEVPLKIDLERIKI